MRSLKHFPSNVGNGVSPIQASGVSIHLRALTWIWPFGGSLGCNSRQAGCSKHIFRFVTSRHRYPEVLLGVCAAPDEVSGAGSVTSSHSITPICKVMNCGGSTIGGVPTISCCDHSASISNEHHLSRLSRLDISPVAGAAGDDMERAHRLLTNSHFTAKIIHRSERNVDVT